MISQIKTNSVLVLKGKRIRVTKLGSQPGLYREVSLRLYGKNKTSKIAKFIGVIKGLEQIAVVLGKDKGKKTHYLLFTNIHLSAMDVIKYYAKGWEIEQMIKNLK